mmetsp:Transcript_20524/g.41070  ORF Transcript_20524/g.41070 Transcript_20524/m.41070 type:complete len:88 (+) Transcript_20524:75-338(+)
MLICQYLRNEYMDSSTIAYQKTCDNFIIQLIGFRKETWADSMFNGTNRPWVLLALVTPREGRKEIVTCANYQQHLIISKIRSRIIHN